MADRTTRSYVTRLGAGVMLWWGRAPATTTCTLYWYFFFSSRRRHTRCSRDWSSDVCSSDLHFVDQEIREEVGGLVAERLHRCVAGGERRRVTEGTSHFHEQIASVTDGIGAAGRREGRGGRRQEAHEEGELLDPVQSARGRGGFGVGDVVRDGRELARRIFLALRRKHLIADSHFDGVREAGVEQQGFILGLPAKPGDRSVDAIVVGAAGDALVLLDRGVGGLIGEDRAVRNVLDQTRAKEIRRKSEDQVVGRGRRVEVGQSQDAAAPSRPPGDGGRVFHAAIPASVWLELEMGLLHRSVQPEEEGDTVGAAVLRGEGHLRIHERAGAPGGRLAMAADTAVEVHARPESIGHALGTFELRLCVCEELELPGGQPDDRTTTARHSTAHARVTRACYRMPLMLPISAVTILGLSGPDGGPAPDEYDRHDYCQIHPALQCVKVHASFSM